MISNCSLCGLTLDDIYFLLFADDMVLLGKCPSELKCNIDLPNKYCNKYGVGEFISGVHFALRSLLSRTLFTLFYGLILGLKISQPDLRKSLKLSIVRIYFISYK